MLDPNSSEQTHKDGVLNRSEEEDQTCTFPPPSFD